MEPRDQYEIYKIFCDLMKWYSKDMSLSMADNEIARRYTSSVAKLRRYLVQRFANCGFNDVEAHHAFDEKTGIFLVKNHEYKWINRYSYPEIGELEDEAKKLYNASENCHWDTYKMAISIADFVEEVMSNLEKYNYRISAEIKRKVEIVISNRELALRCISGTFGNVISIENGEYTNIDLEMRYRRRFFWDFVSDVFNYFYRYFKQRNDEITFFKIFETAHLNTRYGGQSTIEDSIRETYKLFKVPANPNYHIAFEYTTLDSVTPKVKVATPTVKPKTVATPKPKKEVVKEEVTKKATEVKPKPKTEVVKPVVIEQKVNVVDKAVNVLEISKYTKLANGYKIEKVNNVAKKLIIDDSVVEISPIAFSECYLLEEVTLSKNLKTLRFGLFANLMNLEKVNFVEGLEVIENNVFEQSGLKGDVILPDSLVSIGKKAFYTRVPKLLCISLSEKLVSSIDTKISFHSLTAVDIRGEVKEESKSKYTDVCTSSLAFECEINFYTSTAVDLYKTHEAYVIPSGIKKISFREQSKNGIDVSKIKKFYIGGHVEEIFERAFVMFTELEELEFDEDSCICSLPSYMIGDCKITHITIPDSVEQISRNCFALCKSLKSISVGDYVNTYFLNLPEGCKIIVRK